MTPSSPIKYQLSIGRSSELYASEVEHIQETIHEDIPNPNPTTSSSSISSDILAETSIEKVDFVIKDEPFFKKGARPLS